MVSGSPEIATSLVRNRNLARPNGSPLLELSTVSYGIAIYGLWLSGIIDPLVRNRSFGLPRKLFLILNNISTFIFWGTIRRTFRGKPKAHACSGTCRGGGRRRRAVLCLLLFVCVVYVFLNARQNYSPSFLREHQLP